MLLCVRPLTLFVSGVLILGGCGSGGGGGDAEVSKSTTTVERPTRNLERDSVEACLKESPKVGELTRFDEGNQLATPAGEGELRVEFGGNELNIAFERSESDAESRERNLREFNEIYDEGYQRELVIRRGNAVWEWANTPTPSEELTLDRCLAQ